MTSPADDTVDLYLSDIHNFFQTPEVDPFLGENIEASGIDQLIDTMNARPQSRGDIKNVVIHLPEALPEPNLPVRVRTAITNYCDAQIRLAVQKKREIWLEGRKSLKIGLVFWAICLALSLLFEEVIFTRHVFGRLFGEGFIIAGWVGLWRPAELLLYDWRPYAREKKRYEEIKAMNVAIVPHAAAETRMPPSI
ncbi:MAG: hypothetical protein P0Y66_15665 [Candidatus Kaistia colombiensis]|nr:MAG: hypothetical protein P0Y66_15665 [Kaistia sp.]